MDRLTAEQIERATDIAKTMGITQSQAEEIIASGSGHGCLVNEG